MTYPHDARTTVTPEVLPDVSQDGRLGPYRLIREIGHGGMGTVYLGVRDDDAFQKRVAIKVLKRGMDTDSIVRRFRHERQILASLEHPNIARLLDGGSTPDGRPYFAMEYVEGQPIVDYCDTHRLDTAARLELFRHVCTAVQYAHQNLVIHRDIKPANVLVIADGTPKLLDFGIAKLLNPELGRPDARADRARAAADDAGIRQPRAGPRRGGDHRHDVYSLGVLLYELLAGRLPYRLTSRAPADIVRIVCESEPIRPSTAITSIDPRRRRRGAAHRASRRRVRRQPRSATAALTVDVDRLRRQLAGDLDNIMLKALSKEPQRRYASVDQFSEDVRRHLAGLPVHGAQGHAGATAPPSSCAAIAPSSAPASSTFAVLVAGIIGTTWQARVARAERARAEQRFGDVRQLANAFLFDFHDSIARPGRLDAGAQAGRDQGPRIPGPARAATPAIASISGARSPPPTSRSATSRAVRSRPTSATPRARSASYRKAVALYESITGDAARDEARAPRPGAGLHAPERRARGGRRRPPTRCRSRRRGWRSSAQCRRTPTDPPAARRALVASYTRVGDMLAATGNVTAALEHRRTALAIMESVAAAAPDDVANIRQLGVAYQKLGNTLGNPNAPNVGDTAGALAALERSVGDLPQRLGPVSEQRDVPPQSRRRREQRRRRPVRDEAGRRGAGPGAAQPGGLRSAGRARIRPTPRRRTISRSATRRWRSSSMRPARPRRGSPRSSAPPTSIAGWSPPIRAAAT